jgi:hypothetical protein
MKPLAVTYIEFLGGPEDGRVLEVGYLETLFHGANAEGADQIPMIERDMHHTGTVYRVIGCYVARERKGKKLLYHWMWVRQA